MVELVPTGISGLDDLLEGGIPARSAVLVSGRPGTGKTLFGMEYLYHGAAELHEPGIMISYEETREDIRDAAHEIGLDDWAVLVESGDIIVHDKRDMLADQGFSATVDRLLDVIQAREIDRFLLDSLSMFGLLFEEERDRREYLLKFADILKRNGLTALLIAEETGGLTDVDVGLENYLTDGNIRFIQTPTNRGVNRYVWVTKMRRSAADNDIFPMEISDDGITIHTAAGEYSLLDGPAFPGGGAGDGP